MRFIVKIIFLLITINFYAQESFRLINNHEKDVDKNDLNQLYINEKIKKIINLDSNNFRPGFIIKSKDTVKCQIYLKKNKLNSDSYLFTLVKLDISSDIFVLTGKDISGYIVNGATFMSHCSDQKTGKSYSFIKFIESGKITLFERDGTPNNTEFTYLFKKQGEGGFSILTPNSDNLLYYNNWTNKDGSQFISIATNQIDEKFKAFSKQYFSDCPEIVNMISTGYYTIKNFARIITEYNYCN